MDLVPAGFRVTAHPVFLDYLPPSVEVQVREEGEEKKKEWEEIKDERDVAEHAEKNIKQKGYKRKRKHDTSHADDSIVDAAVSVKKLGKTASLEKVEFSEKEHCSICLCPHHKPITLLSCCHSFCRDCALLWFRKKAMCPLCKTPAKHFIQNKCSTTHKSVRDKTALVSVMAIYRDSEEFKNLCGISRSTVTPAIRKHLERFACSDAKQVPCD